MASKPFGVIGNGSLMKTFDNYGDAVRFANAKKKAFPAYDFNVKGNGEDYYYRW